MDLKHYDLGTWTWYICDGRGTEKPLFSKRDYFTLVADSLEDPEESVRSAAAMDLCTFTMIMGKRYGVVQDAYIDAGRSGELLGKLEKAWRGAPALSEERLFLGRALAELMMRRHLWAHPELAEQAGLRVYTAPYRGWSGFYRGRQRRFFAERLLAEGHERFREVWEDYQKHMEDLRARWRGRANGAQ